MADEALPAKVRFGELVAGFKRAARRHPRPAELTAVLIESDQAGELEGGIAVERLWLRRLDDGIAELVIQTPGDAPPRLLGWTPIRTPRRRPERRPGRRPERPRGNDPRG